MRCLRFTCESHSPPFFRCVEENITIQEEGDRLENFNVVKILIDIIRTLARQDIAFRGGGNLEINGNFNQIVMLMAWGCLELR